MAFLAALQLGLPWMLLGLAALALPLLAHVMGRLTRRKVVFPSLWLLDQALGPDRGWERWRRRLLLALRCLALAALVLAFARPQWRYNSNSAMDQRGPGVKLVLVLDNSASARRRAGSVDLMQVLRGQALRTIHALVQGRDWAGVVLAASDPQTLRPGLVSDLVALEQDLANVQGSDARADLEQAIQRAAAQLQAAGGGRLVLLSDMQASNWPGHLPPLSAAVELRAIALGDGGAPNVAISSPRAVGATAPGQAQLSVRLTNHGDESAHVSLRVAVDDQQAGEQELSLGPRESIEPQFEVTPGEGERQIRFSIEVPEAQDVLAVDNQALAVFSPLRQRLVALISDDDIDRPGTAGYFLDRALAPLGLGDAVGVVRLNAAQVNAASLARMEAAVLGQVAALEPQALAALREMQSRGGGLIVLAPSLPVLETLRADLGLGGPGVARQADPTTPWRLARADWQSPLLASWDAASRETLRMSAFHQIIPMALPAGRPLLWFQDDTPALYECSFGKGIAFVAGFGVEETQSDLGRSGLWVALVQGMMERLLKASSPALALAGQPLLIPSLPGFSAAGLVSVVTPGGETLAVNAANAWTPWQQGFYRLQDLQGRPLGQIAVNIDPRECDLRAVNITPVDQNPLHASRLALGADEGPTQTSFVALWPWLILASLTFLAVELTLLALEPH